MTERLTDEQLQAIRERIAAVKAAAQRENDAREALKQDASAAEKHYALLNAEFEWEDARREAEAFASEDVEALLAHIDALEAALAKALDMCTPPAIEVMPSPEGYYYKCLSCGNVGAEVGEIHHSPNCPAGCPQAVDAD